MLATFRRWFRPAPPQATFPLRRSEDGAVLAALRVSVEALTADVRALQANETARLAEHALMIDKLDRFYKRLSARLARNGESGEGESPLALRRRLRGE